MKSLAFAGFLMISILTVGATDKITTIIIGSKSITNIDSVTIAKDGRVSIIYSTSGVHATFEELPKAFLASWGITKDAVESARAASEKETAIRDQEDLARAVRRGLFRRIGDVVYDLRKPQPSFVWLKECKLFRKLEYDPNGFMAGFAGPDALVYASFGSTHRRGKYTFNAMHLVCVHNLPKIDKIAHEDTFDVFAQAAGAYDYKNKAGTLVSLKAFDAGIEFSVDQIPDAILKEKKASAPVKPESNSLGETPKSEKSSLDK